MDEGALDRQPDLEMIRETATAAEMVSEGVEPCSQCETDEPSGSPPGYCEDCMNEFHEEQQQRAEAWLQMVRKDESR